jgi:hypothetical protein
MAIAFKKGVSMKRKLLFMGFFICLTGLAAIPSDADQQYRFMLPSYAEPIYGTWINENYAGQSSESAQKTIYYKWGYGEVFKKASDANLTGKFTFILVEKWTGSDGSIWYKEFDLMSYGVRYYCLTRISKDGKTLETITSIGVMEFPSESDLNPKRDAYRIFYRR